MNGSAHAYAEPAILGWMSALADPTRSRTLRLIERHELTVADLCTVLQAPQSTVSRHLKVLADDGWVSARPEGPRRLYRMATDLDPAARRLWSLLREQVADTPAAGQDDRRLARVLDRRRQRSRAFFRSAAGRWGLVRHELFGDRFHLRALAALLDPTWRVADLGCGTGEIAEALAPFVGSVVAIENSAPMLRAARRRLSGVRNVELRRGDLEALPLADASLDAAVMCLVLHHVAEPAQVLAEACRALRPGGRLLLVDMLEHGRVEYRQQMGHVWLGFSAGQIERWLAETGFGEVRLWPLPPDPQAKGPSLFAARAARLAPSPAGASAEEDQTRRRRRKR